MSTGERTTEDRAAAIEALTATLTAGLTEDEVTADAAYGFWRAGADGSIVDDSYAAYVAKEVDNVSRAHILRHAPVRATREIKAKRDLITAILAEPHAVIPGDEFYSCSQAADPDPAPGEGGPGSGCADPDRAGQPCDCGRDARVERLLRILAGVYEDGGRP